MATAQDPTPLSSSITAATANDKQDIQNLVRLWDLDILDPNMGQGTWVTFPTNPQPNDYRPHRQGWRIDNQKNGAYPIGNLLYYTLAVQNGSAVYSNIQAPQSYRLGRTRIRNAFLESMDKQKTARIVFPIATDTQPPAQGDRPAAGAEWVQSLNWRLEFHTT